MLRAQVLLSTFDGERYLPALLDSLWRQEGVEVRVLARDDGSRDGTVELLERQGARIDVHRGPNLGPARSFLWLLRHAATDVDIVALADQDDVWLPGKLARAARLLAAAPPAPAQLYCSAARLVDHELRDLGQSPALRRPPSFANSLVENVVTGCTAVLNQAAIDLVRDSQPAVVHMHDWWLYQVIAGRGRIVYDEEPQVLYRQHGANAVGGTAGSLAAARARLRRVRARGRAVLAPTQLAELRRLHGEQLAPRDRGLLDAILDRRTLRNRLALALSPDLVCQRPWKSAALRMLYLAGRA